MAQTLRDMEQEAEPEGGEIADRYGTIMMKQEKEYAKLKAKKAKIDARVEKYRMS
jgi:cell division protein FtsB